MPKPIIQAKFQVQLKNADLKKLSDRLAKEGGFVTVGVHEDAGRYKSGIPVALVATFHEFGAPRARVPERSFIRSSIRDNMKLINDWRVGIMQKILNNQITTEKALRNIGFLVTEVVKNRIKSGVPPPLSKRTIESKMKRGLAPKEGQEGAGSFPFATPLIDTTLLLRSIKYKVYLGPKQKPQPEGK